MERSVRVKPGVQLQSSLMRFIDRKGQGIIKRLRRFAHRAAEILRPRLNLRSVERIAHRPNLKHDRVQLQLSRLVEDGDQLRLLLLGA